MIRTYKGLADQIHNGLAASMPQDVDIASVAEAILNIVDMPFGKWPFRIHIDIAQDGCEVVNSVAEPIRAELLHRISLEDLFTSQMND
jgi:hypothetical protein